MSEKIEQPSVPEPIPEQLVEYEEREDIVDMKIVEGDTPIVENHIEPVVMEPPSMPKQAKPSDIHFEREPVRV